MAASTATTATTAPLNTSDNHMTFKRGKRSVTTPPTRRKISIGTEEKIKTVPMAAAEPVFSSTHQARAMRYRLLPMREIVWPLHNKAKGRWVRARNKVMCEFPRLLWVKVPHPNRNGRGCQSIEGDFAGRDQMWSGNYGCSLGNARGILIKYEAKDGCYPNARYMVPLSRQIHPMHYNHHRNSISNQKEKIK